MKKSHFIQKTTAVLLLIVFAFAITPSVVFHNWLAGHTDTTNRLNEQEGDNFQHTSITCKIDHVVAESPFTGTFQSIANPLKPVYTALKVPVLTAFSSATTSSYSLRGPPVAL